MTLYTYEQNFQIGENKLTQVYGIKEKQVE